MARFSDRTRQQAWLIQQLERQVARMTPAEVIRHAQTVGSIAAAARNRRSSYKRIGSAITLLSHLMDISIQESLAQIKLRPAPTPTDTEEN